MKKVTRLSIKPEPQIPTQTQTKAENQQEATSQPKTSTSAACQRVNGARESRHCACRQAQPIVENPMGGKKGEKIQTGKGGNLIH